MTFKIDRLIDEEFKYSYRDFYYQTKKELVGRGINVGLKVQYDLLKGLQLIGTDNRKVQIKSINQLLCCNLFSFCQAPSSVPLNNLNTLYHLYEKNQIPLFANDEKIEIAIWSKDKSKAVIVLINSMSDLVLKFDEVNLSEILKECLETNSLKFRVKILEESPSRSKFEKIIFEDMVPEFQKMIIEKVINNYSSPNLQTKINALSGIFQYPLDCLEDHKDLRLKSADRVLAYLYSSLRLGTDGTLQEYMNFFDNHCESKIKIYNLIIEIIMEEEKNTLIYLNPHSV